MEVVNVTTDIVVIVSLNNWVDDTLVLALTLQVVLIYCLGTE